MHRLLVFTFLMVSADAGLLRVPKIYNALISSDENLSPSHTYPLVEPVFRTTALGVAFPPLLASPPHQKEVPPTEQINDKKEETTLKSTENEDRRLENLPKKNEKIYPQLSYHGTLYPLAFDPYLPYAYTNDFLFPALPYYEHPALFDLNHFKGKEKVREREEPNPAVNFKKNPEIPDVPPPPLPVKTDRKEKP